MKMSKKTPCDAVQTPHDELCDDALKHYNEISTEAMHWNSLIPDAINFYKKHWKPKSESL